MWWWIENVWIQNVTSKGQRYAIKGLFHGIWKTSSMPAYIYFACLPALGILGGVICGDLEVG